MLCSFCQQKIADDIHIVGLCTACWNETAPDMQAVILDGEYLWWLDKKRFRKFFPERMVVEKENSIGDALDAKDHVSARPVAVAESPAVDAYEKTIKEFDALNISLGADAEDYFDLLLGYLEDKIKVYAKQRKKRLRDHLKSTKWAAKQSSVG